MKKIKNEGRKCQGALQPRHVKKLVVMPLARRMMNHAVASQKLGRRIFKKVQEVGKLIEIIAREIKRQSERGN